MTGPVNTDRELAALRPQARRYERAVTKARGLSVVVFPNGAKTFVLRYVAEGGARRRLPLGDHPGMSVEDARIRAGALRAEVAAGGDPAAALTRRRQAARFGESLEDLAEKYWIAAAAGIHGGRKRPLRPGTLERQKLLWAKHIRPVLGRRNFKTLRRGDVRAFMNGFVLARKLSPHTIATIGDLLRALFTYAVSEELVETNPTLGLTRPVAPQPRERMFGEAALRALWSALVDASATLDSTAGRDDPAARLEGVTAVALRFLILTLTRRSEAAGARWEEIDFVERVWVIPGERTKNRRPHVIPLSPEALALLEQLRRSTGAEGYLFLSDGAAGHIDPRSLTRAVSRLCRRLKLPPGSPHDFRRTGATILTGERFGVRRFVIGKVLGHTAHEGAAVTAVYDRNEYLPEKRQALEAWGRFVAGPQRRPAVAPPRPPARVRARRTAGGAEVIDLFRDL